MQNKQMFWHAFASPEEEATTEANAKAKTQALKDMTAKKKPWEKYNKKKKK